MTVASPLRTRGTLRQGQRYLMIGAGVFVGEALLLALLFGAKSGALISTGADGDDLGEAGAFVVSMQKGDGEQTTPASPPAERFLAEARALNADAPSPLTLQDSPKPPRAQDLDQLFGAAKPEPRPVTRPGGGPKVAQTVSDLSGAKSTGDLWSAIAPCWKTRADAQTLAVTLEIEVSMSGALTKPPKILRQAGKTPDAQTLRSEVLALSALAACTPLHAAIGKGPTQIHFPGKAP